MVNSSSPSQLSCADLAHVFAEKMYLLEHPGKVEEFDHLNETAIGERSVFISRAWLRGIWVEFLRSPPPEDSIDWHLKIPKFHNSNPQYVGDPPPDAFPWRSHVFCEHGGLKPSHADRSTITHEVITRHLLTELPLTIYARPPRSSLISSQPGRQ
jgi:ubiquitin carboxyl-terminal hydrolase 48